MKFLVMILMLVMLVAGGVSAQEVKREITRVTFDTYRFQNKFHVNMFVITGDGVVDIDDVVRVILDWGPCSGCCLSDVDGNGIVDIDDLVVDVILNWS